MAVCMHIKDGHMLLLLWRPPLPLITSAPAYFTHAPPSTASQLRTLLRHQTCTSNPAAVPQVPLCLAGANASTLLANSSRCGSS
jgi:hypothetical protein